MLFLILYTIAGIITGSIFYVRERKSEEGLKDYNTTEHFYIPIACAMVILWPIVLIALVCYGIFRLVYVVYKLLDNYI